MNMLGLYVLCVCVCMCMCVCVCARLRAHVCVHVCFVCVYVYVHTLYITYALQQGCNQSLGQQFNFGKLCNPAYP